MFNAFMLPHLRPAIRKYFLYVNLNNMMPYLRPVKHVHILFNLYMIIDTSFSNTYHVFVLHLRHAQHLLVGTCL